MSSSESSKEGGWYDFRTLLVCAGFSVDRRWVDSPPNRTGSLLLFLEEFIEGYVVPEWLDKPAGSEGLRADSRTALFVDIFD